MFYAVVKVSFRRTAQCKGGPDMKKIISLLLAVLMVVSFSTVAFAADDGATISGKVEVPFTFNNDGRVILKQGENPVKIVNINADGSYLLSNLAAGTYNLVISIPGWTEFTVTEINIADNEDVDIFGNAVIAGDFDKSGVIDIKDAAAAVVDLGDNVSSSNINSDVDHSKNVNIGDISVILAAENFGKEAYVTDYFNDGWSHTY